MLCNQVKEITMSFNESMIKTYRLMGNRGLFRNLTCMVSAECIKKLAAEYEKGVDSSISPHCNCSTRVIFGLPCVHDIAVYVRDQIPLPLESVHIFWRTLKLDQPCVDDVDSQEVRQTVNRRLFDDFI